MVPNDSVCVSPARVGSASSTPAAFRAENVAACLKVLGANQGSEQMARGEDPNIPPLCVP